MWLYVDETWPPKENQKQFGILLGVLIEHGDTEPLDNLLYRTQRKYYGTAQAKDSHKELKGQQLLSNQILKKQNKQREIPRNLSIIKEILSHPRHEDGFPLDVFASVVYSQTNHRPELLSPNPKLLARPFQHLVTTAAEAASERGNDRVVNLVFDQRLAAQKEIAISIKNFVSGMQLSNVHHCPYFAVSHTCPGVQVADIFASLMSKRVQDRREIFALFKDLEKLGWYSEQTGHVGIRRFDEHLDETKGIHHTVRKKW